MIYAGHTRSATPIRPLKPNLSNTSEAIRKLNPDLFATLGRLGSKVDRKQARALVSCSPAERRGQARIRAGVEITVTLTAYVVRRLDPDNLAGALKPMQDTIADYLGIDDGDPRIRWECGCVETRGREGVIVTIQVGQTL
jgi:hypothetical protein